ncbi:hypothetical protein [Arsenophonus nasoniae]|uniref:Uncharacterized protein n=1 Tax=Arsenophonus nasoniae TaxID=638 RepID=A0AA95K570_9GAMM|nr:hypothetical protein [Arsenophonus nasoniae]WGL96750.1 hypothetical protein QE207_09570 [Arsenophonus nasoniae]
MLTSLMFTGSDSEYAKQQALRYDNIIHKLEGCQDRDIHENINRLAPNSHTLQAIRKQIIVISGNRQFGY